MISLNETLHLMTRMINNNFEVLNIKKYIVMLMMNTAMESIILLLYYISNICVTNIFNRGLSDMMGAKKLIVYNNSLRCFLPLINFIT